MAIRGFVRLILESGPFGDQESSAMRLMPSLLGCLFLAASGLLAVTTESERETWNRPLPDWWQGPVRYALTDEEVKEYRSLGTPAERAAFIARFWAGRDPDPFTPVNEAEDTFWKRVSAADELFSPTTISGWRTDRGRVYIVLGAPDEILDRPLPAVDEMSGANYHPSTPSRGRIDLEPGHRGSVEWVYRNLRTPLADAGQRVVFVRDETGEFQIFTPLDESLRFASGTQSSLTQAPRPEQVSVTRAEANRFSVSANSLFSFGQASLFEKIDTTTQSAENLFSFGQASLFERVEPPSSRGRVAASEFFGVVLIQHRTDFFQGPSGTTALFTVGVPSGELGGVSDSSPELELFGRLAKMDDPSQVYQFSTSRKASDPAPAQRVDGQDFRLFQIRGVLPPGTYQMNLGAKVGPRIGTLGDRLEIPAFDGEALILDGPILADKVGEGRSDEEESAFTMGSLRLVPKLDPTYATGDDFGFYFQVYHARRDGREGRLRLDIDYTISTRRQGLYHLLGKPVFLHDNAAPLHAYHFPLRGWPPGEYLLTVTVTDRTTGEIRAGSVAFRVQ